MGSEYLYATPRGKPEEDNIRLMAEKNTKWFVWKDYWDESKKEWEHTDKGPTYVNTIGDVVKWFLKNM